MKQATIKALCPQCGEQSLLASGVHLVVFDTGTSHYYEFFCPSCRNLVRRPADKNVQKLLVAGKVLCDYIHVPYEVAEHVPGPVLTEDDLLTFAKELAETTDVSLQAAIENAR